MFLLFAVISWLAADDEALLSLSLQTCDLSETGLKNGPVSSRINNCDPHDDPQCTKEGCDRVRCLEVLETDLFTTIEKKIAKVNLQKQLRN